MRVANKRKSSTCLRWTSQSDTVDLLLEKVGGSQTQSSKSEWVIPNGQVDGRELEGGLLASTFLDDASLPLE